MIDLATEMSELRQQDVMTNCRELFDRFGGKDRLATTMGQQADLVEYLLRKCVPHSGGGAVLAIYTDLDAAQLADMSVLALRLRKMAPHEAGIRELVTGRQE